MNYLKLFLFSALFFSCSQKISSQISKSERISKVEKIQTALTNSGEADIYDIRKIAGYYREKRDYEKLNDFFAMIFSFPPTELKLEFLEELNHYIFSYIAYKLNERNRMKLHESFQVSRARVIAILQPHMKTTIAVGNYNSGLDSIEFAAVNYSQVIRTYEALLGLNYHIVKPHRDSMFPASKRIISKYRYRESMTRQYGQEAFYNFVRMLPVDDFRFKMFAKKNIYDRYRRADSRIYDLINFKLNAAGYDTIPVLWENGFLISPEYPRSTMTEEEVRKKYDWVKKKE